MMTPCSIAGCVFVAVAAMAAASGADSTPLQTLREKGVTPEAVLKNAKGFTPARPRPQVRYLTQGDLLFTNDAGGVEHRRVELRVQKHSAGAEGRRIVRFGMPFPKGEIYRLDQINVTGHAEMALPIQTHALALWPDGSIKAALIQAAAELPEKGDARLTLHYGQKVAAPPLPDAIVISQGAEEWTISNGKFTLRLSPKAFAPLGEMVLHDAWITTRLVDDGIVLRDEAGRVYSSTNAPVESICLERHGPLDAQIRVEGHLADASGRDKHFRYIVRLRVVADRPRAEVSVTFINDRLENEFTDFRSISQSIRIPGRLLWDAAWEGTGGAERMRHLKSLRQWSENEVTGGGKATGRLQGAFRVSSLGRTVSFFYQDWWQRWPKGVTFNPGKVELEHLPPLPVEFGRGLPEHLRYPFVEGGYRMKWGMAFTERYTVDLEGGASEEEVLVRLPPGYVAETGVYGQLPLEETDRVKRWNAYVERSLADYLKHRDESRAYGFLNWGDWWGERGRNWGNNEYNLPHGLFLQYLLTGDARYYQIALRGVWHQVDSDIVHAYPDAYYIGANAQHGIGHTGITSHDIPARWSFPYGHTIDAGNGHTWADGMADCWLLSGDATVMEGLINLGEHIRFAYALSAPSLGTHHRGIGWAALAAAATYRATGDDAYLEGMRLLLEAPIAQWDKASGIWPYELARGHANGKSGVHGSSLYNLGILLQALARYHDLTGDVRVPEILQGASRWLVRTFLNERGWPYSATTEGEPLRQNPSMNLNALIYPPLIYTGRELRGPESEAALQTAVKAFDATFAETDRDALPKEFSIKAYATLEALGLLENPTQSSYETDP